MLPDKESLPSCPAGTGPPLKPVQVPLDGIPSLNGINHTTQLGVISKLSMSLAKTLNSTGTNTDP